jgi:YcaO-like protein with predicted kinase domain
MNLHRTLPASLMTKRAYQVACQYGIVRSFPITHFDRIGIPVWAAVRPFGRAVLVHSGKGFTNAVAHATALMEALECAEAEVQRHELLVSASAEAHARREVLDPVDFGVPAETFTDVPGADRWIFLDPIRGGTRATVPAAKVFLVRGGSTTAGLAAGATVEDATLHALLEVVERDVQSFELVSPSGRPLKGTLPRRARLLAGRIHRAGLSLRLLHAANEFEIPFISALLWDDDEKSPRYYNGGQACHVDVAVAIERAILEAVQSRCAFIHGGRADLEDFDRFNGVRTAAEQTQHCEQLIAKYSNCRRVIRVSAIRNPANVSSVEEAIDAVCDRLVARGLGEPLRYVFRKDPIAIVRVVVPRAENLSSRSVYVGRRLIKAIRQR